MAASTGGPVPALGADLLLALSRAGLSLERCGAGLLRLRAPSGRTVYVEERPHGCSGRASWLVHVDPFGTVAARQVPCATVGAVLIAVRSALAGVAPARLAAVRRD